MVLLSETMLYQWREDIIKHLLKPHHKYITVPAKFSVKHWRPTRGSAVIYDATIIKEVETKILTHSIMHLTIKYNNDKLHIIFIHLSCLRSNLPDSNLVEELQTIKDTMAQLREYHHQVIIIGDCNGDPWRCEHQHVIANVASGLAPM